MEELFPPKIAADFVRLVVSPDTSIDKDLYRIFDFYPNGNRKRTATSFTANGNLILDGTCIDFFPNGKRKSVISYSKGYPKGDLIRYYPNGQIYLALRITPNLPYYSSSLFTGSYWSINSSNSDIRLLECRDSTGKILAINGNGKLILFDDDFKLFAEGQVKKDKKEGEWIGPIADSGKFVIQFHKDEIKSGNSYLKSGKHICLKN